MNKASRQSFNHCLEQSLSSDKRLKVRQKAIDSIPLINTFFILKDIYQENEKLHIL